MDTNEQNSSNLEIKDNVVSLFNFIKEMNKLRKISILNIDNYPWKFNISDIPKNLESIVINYRDRNSSEEEDSYLDDVLLSVKKQEFEICPNPDPIFIDWLDCDWKKYTVDATVKAVIYKKEVNKTIEEIQPDYNENKEYFDDDIERVNTFYLWKEKREQWRERQMAIAISRKLFEDLYSLYFKLQNESETMELVVADGFILDKRNPSIKHPILTKRVKLDYDPEENIVLIKETETNSEIYSAVFQELNGVNNNAEKEIQLDLKNNFYHPLDRIDTKEFF